MNAESGVPCATLPLELVSQVFSYLVPEAEFALTKRDLQSCSLVCKAWRDLSVSYIFSSIPFTFSYWPGDSDCNGEQDRPAYVSEKSWIPVSPVGTGSPTPCYLPKHRFPVLFHFFRAHPSICQYVRSLRLVALRYAVSPKQSQASAAQWLSRFMGSCPVDRAFFLSTVKLFPRLKRLCVEQITLTSAPTEAGSPRVPLESLSVDFGRASMFANHTSGVGRDGDLARTVGCFDGLQELSISRYTDRTTTIFSPTFTPELRLHSLSINHSAITGQSLLEFPYTANLRTVHIDVYMVSPDEAHHWETLFKTMGPRLENLECRINVGARCKPTITHEETPRAHL